MEFFSAIALLLWAGVAALAVAYLWRRPRRRPRTHAWPHAARLLGTTAPSVQLDGGGALQSGGLLFLDPGCRECEAVIDEIEAGGEVPAGLVTVGGRAPSVRGHTRHVGDPRATELRKALEVAELPYLWVVRGGSLRAGGAVRSVADIESLLQLAD